MNEKTKVIFRTFYPEKGGEVIAIFPELAGDSNPYRTCMSYMHVGQHGAVSLDYTEFTFPSRADEVEPLKRELESLGYDLKVIKRMRQDHLRLRKQETEESPC